jgi:hypothetical protein
MTNHDISQTNNFSHTQKSSNMTISPITRNLIIMVAVFFAIISTTHLQAQSKGSTGNTVNNATNTTTVAKIKKDDIEGSFKDCGLVVAGFTYCKVCDDKEMTKNCKKYYCDGDDNCEEVPFKKNQNLYVVPAVTPVKKL